MSPHCQPHGLSKKVDFKKFVMLLLSFVFLVLPSHLIGIDDGTTLTYHKTINATCVEKKLGDKFSGWELDVTKPIEELEVKL